LAISLQLLLKSRSDLRIFFKLLVLRLAVPHQQIWGFLLG
jgi:hypothetical protein